MGPKELIGLIKKERETFTSVLKDLGYVK